MNRIYYDTEFLEGTQTCYSWLGLKTDTWIRIFSVACGIMAISFAWIIGIDYYIAGAAWITLLIGSAFLWGLSMPSTPPTIDLISIGMVRQDGEEYYAISKDFNLKEAWNRWDGEYHEQSGFEKQNGLSPRKKYWIR